MSGIQFPVDGSLPSNRAGDAFLPRVKLGRYTVFTFAEAFLEFFSIADSHVSVEALQALTVDKLDRFCADIDQVMSVKSINSADVYCLWGIFNVERQIINGGVRFTLPKCPNALAWTITTGFDPAPGKVVIHCTINRTQHDAEFIESIESFIQSWKAGLERHFPG